MSVYARRASQCPAAIARGPPPRADHRYGPPVPAAPVVEWHTRVSSTKQKWWLAAAFPTAVSNLVGPVATLQ